MACTIDFRYLDDGYGDVKKKRKRHDQPLPMDLDDDDDGGGAAHRPTKRQAIPSSSDPSKPSFGRPTYDGVIAGKVSGRKWKQPRPQRSSAMRVSRKGADFEQRARQKEVKRAYRERMEELKEDIRKNKVEKRKRREERVKKKEENIMKSGTKLQVITNPKTLKKIAKSKRRKDLKVVPDEMVKRK